MIAVVICSVSLRDRVEGKVLRGQKSVFEYFEAAV